MLYVVSNLRKNSALGNRLPRERHHAEGEEHCREAEEGVEVPRDKRTWGQGTGRTWGRGALGQGRGHKGKHTVESNSPHAGERRATTQQFKF